MSIQNIFLFFHANQASILKQLAYVLKNIHLATLLYNQKVFLCSKKKWKAMFETEKGKNTMRSNGIYNSLKMELLYIKYFHDMT